MTEITQRLSTALADRYKIERHLGEGGMATVYLAEDLKHKRKVAVKVLRPELAAILGAERFLKEIEVTANLQHPNILPLYDSGEADTFLYYVMPYIEGETLRDKLNREKQLGVEETVEIAKSVAGALSFAHSRGVIHRDIKPDNILLQSGQALVADFGIALAVSQASGTRLTETGLSLGTPHYMSPEQATGDRELDARSDVYSLGAMVYEMLVGDPPHIGSSAQAIIAKILSERPSPITQSRDLVPANVDAAVEKALAKSPADRFTTAAEFADALTNPAFTLPTTQAAAVAGAPASESWNNLSVGFAALAALAVVFGVWSFTRAPAGPVMWQKIAPVAVGIPRPIGTYTALAPDGSSMVYAELTGPGAWQLVLKRRGSIEPTPLPGTEQAANVTYSPNSESIAFRAGSEIKTMPIGGGSTVTLAEGIRGQNIGLTWQDDGTILYEMPGSTLMRIAEAGGEAETIAVYAGEFNQLGNFTALPGSRGVLIMRCVGGCGGHLAVVDFEADTTRVLLPGVLKGWYVPTGHLMYVRRDGAVFAAPFDLGALQLTGPGIPLFQDVTVITSSVDLVVAANGTVLYRQAASVGARRELVWVDRNGEAQPVDPDMEPDVFGNLALAPDDGRVALTGPIGPGGRSQLWVKQLPDGPMTPLTNDTGITRYPAWSPDGSTIAYSTNDGGWNARSVPADGSLDGGFDVLLTDDRGVREVSYAPDGTGLLVVLGLTGSNVDVGFLDLATDSLRGDVLASSQFYELGASLSHNGRWIAYTSNLSGQNEIYVRPFPSADVRVQVSRGGGYSPVWGHNGRELFFIGGRIGQVRSGSFTESLSAPEMHVATYRADSTFHADAPRRLFDAKPYFLADQTFRSFDVTQDDQRFLMMRTVSSAADATSFIYIQNFFEELKERVGR